MHIKKASGLGITLFAAGLLAGAVHAATLTISCGAVGSELQLCEEGTKLWSEKTGHKVELVSTPNSSTERLSLYQQLLSARSKDIDVFQIDVVWPGLLAPHLLDLKPHLESLESQHFESLIANNTIDGRLVAMPWFTDAGVLYYRSDLLEKYQFDVPTTWEELTQTAQSIQEQERAAGQAQFWGFVWQGRAYEGLTCDALEWIYSYNGGTIVDPDGKVTINNPGAISALEMAASWVNTISPPGVLSYAEEESRGVFQSGNALFMRNWPYAWSLGQSDGSPIRGKIGVTALPKGGEDGRPAGTLGGWQLAVSQYSENAELAVDLVRFLTSYDEQKRRALIGSYNPTLPALYEDTEVLDIVPFFGELYETFLNGVPRPSSVTGNSYGRVSNATFNAVHSVLSGSQSAEKAVQELESQLNRMSRRGW